MKTKILENLTRRGGIKPSFLKENNITEKDCYNIINGKHKCKYCENESEFISFNKEYKDTCNETICKKQSYKEKRDKTLMERYGTTDSLSINGGRERGIAKCNNDKDVKEKRKQTCIEKYGYESTFKSQDFQDYLKLCIFEKYGVDNNSKRLDVRETISAKNSIICTSEELIFRRNKVDSEGKSSIDRQKETNILNGKWLPDSEKTEYEIYCREVWKVTRKQDLESLENFEKRGHINDNADAYHLDHKFSMFEGFTQNIPAEIIGDICNLEMVHNKINSRKREKCSITKEELLEKYNEK